MYQEYLAKIGMVEEKSFEGNSSVNSTQNNQSVIKTPRQHKSSTTDKGIAGKLNK